MSDKFMSDLENLVFNLVKEMNIDIHNVNQKSPILIKKIQANLARSMGTNIIKNFPTAEVFNFLRKAMSQE